MAGSFATREMLSGMRKLGLPMGELCAAAGTTAEQLMGSDARIPITVHRAIWLEADRLSGDPSLGFHLAKEIPLAAVGGSIGQLAAASETGLDALRHLVPYGRLIADGMHFEVREDETTATLELRLDAIDETSARHIREEMMTVMCRIFREMVVEPATPARVSFPHSHPPDLAEYERFFGCPVVFGAPTCSMETSLAILEQPIVSRQPRAAKRLQDLLDSELRALGSDFTIAVGEQIRAALEQHDRPTPASIARRLAIGERTLQRRLRDEDNSFRTILEQAQRDVAVALLRDGTRAVDVALAVGFADATSFSKAFRRWTGESPTAYRTRTAGGAADRS